MRTRIGHAFHRSTLSKASEPFRHFLEPISLIAFQENKNDETETCSFACSFVHAFQP